MNALRLRTDHSLQSFDRRTCYKDGPRLLLARVRVRWPGTVDAPLSPPCKLLFSTAFMFSCSAASSAYWIPCGWLSCASDGVVLPNLPLCTKHNDNNNDDDVTDGRLDEEGEKHAVAFGIVRVSVENFVTSAVL